MRRRGETGFTLVELLVVVVLIGLAAGTVVLALPDARDRVDDEAESLAARLVAARDLAIVSGRDTAVRIDGLGYRFEERGLDGWRPATARPLAPREWRGGIVVRPAIDGGAAAIRFDVTGMATPAVVTLQSGPARARVRIGLGGEVRINAG